MRKGGSSATSISRLESWTPEWRRIANVQDGFVSTLSAQNDLLLRTHSMKAVSISQIGYGRPWTSTEPVTHLGSWLSSNTTTYLASARL